jgi:RNA polymerase sigma factor (sigma-70 family)
MMHAITLELKARTVAPSEANALAEWTDAKLINVVRRDPPDLAALDILVQRYWKPLFARCQLLVSSPQRAEDLAQEAWHRVLRARHALKPDGHFLGYLTAIATNLWRDWHRLARRAGPLAEPNLVAFDAPRQGNDNETNSLGETLSDAKALAAHKTKLLALDIDQALDRLTPQLRDVLTARFIIGESCAEIGRRYGRTEQAVSGWVREAVGKMRDYLTSPESRTSWLTIECEGFKNIPASGNRKR